MIFVDIDPNPIDSLETIEPVIVRNEPALDNKKDSSFQRGQEDRDVSDPTKGGSFVVLLFRFQLFSIFVFRHRQARAMESCAMTADSGRKCKKPHRSSLHYFMCVCALPEDLVWRVTFCV